MPPKLVRIGALELRFFVDETDGAGEMVMFEFLVSPGARVPEPHFHRGVDEAIYGLEGSLTSRRGGEIREIGPGDTLFIPRGVVHHHQNLSDKAAKVLIVLTPGSIGRGYFEEVGALVAAGRPDPAAMAEIMHRHGLVPD